MEAVDIATEKVTALRAALARDTVEFAVVFGSRATDDASTHSDIDVAVSFETGDEDTWFTELFRIERVYSDQAGADSAELDFEILNLADGRLQQSIAEEAVFLCGDETAAMEYLES